MIMSDLASVVQIKHRIGQWLASCTGMVAVTILFGCITRLSVGVLSQLDWRFVHDLLPPFSRNEWQHTFDAYKQLPEWNQLMLDKKDQLLSINLSQFKAFYLMEYGQRTIGRLTGLLFFLPAGYFWYRGNFDRTMKRKVLGLGILMAFLAFTGNYTIKCSSAALDLTARNKIVQLPNRADQLLLVGNLGLAYVLYSSLLWLSIEHLLPIAKDISTTVLDRSMLRRATNGSLLLTTLIFITSVIGSHVAATDSGLVCNDFPTMNGRLLPVGMMSLQPFWRNFTENPVLIQFLHRVMAFTTFTGICSYAFFMRRMRLPSRARFALNSMVVIAFSQLALGISTLVLHVPTVLASTHALGSMSLLSVSLWFLNELMRLPK